MVAARSMLPGLFDVPKVPEKIEKEQADSIKNKWPTEITKKIDLYYAVRVQQTWQGGNILRGKIPSNNDITLMDNDYLCISQNQLILKKLANAVMEYGSGSMMSASFSHDVPVIEEVQQALADHLGSESVIICQSGFSANVGLIQALATKSTNIYLDQFAHMSLYEGVKSSGGNLYQFYHNDIAHLEHLIKLNGRGIIAVDSIYSTYGSQCKLLDLVHISEKYGCVLIVDESHSLGTHGDKGEGIVASAGLSGRVDFITASLSKAFSTRAGIISCSKRFHEYFSMTSRPAIFSSMLLPYEFAKIKITLEAIKSMNIQRAKLHSNSLEIIDGLKNIGYSIPYAEAQIIPLISGHEKNTLLLRDALEERGIFGSVFIHPATPKNGSLIRFSVNSDLTPAEIKRFLYILKDIQHDPKISTWLENSKLLDKSHKTLNIA